MTDLRSEGPDPEAPRYPDTETEPIVLPNTDLPSPDQAAPAGSAAPPGGAPALEAAANVGAVPAGAADHLESRDPATPAAASTVSVTTGSLPTDPKAERSRTSLGRRAVIPLLSVFSGLVIGALVIIFSDRAVIGLVTKGDLLGALGAAWTSVSGAYAALFRGSIGDPAAFGRAITAGDVNAFIRALNPISETILATTPLIFTGLAVALGFRSGLFNIGAEGQLYLGAMFATYVGFAFVGLPWFVHLPLAIVAGFIGGALWGFIPGFLKARTGAHEVIVTIMLNYIAYRLTDFVLQQSFFQRPGRDDPVSRTIADTAALPRFHPDLRVHAGILLAIAAAAVVSWLLFRSTKGFEFRAVGLNPQAARYAGMNISRTLILTMSISGALAGLAGASEILGSNKSLTPGFSPGYGFDAIALALLGGSRPLGVVGAALLFGALRAGATPMQAATGIPIDLVVVVQALVIMFTAAPALVRGIYRIRTDRVTGTEVFSKGWGT